jgi:hypothetical protein
MSKMYGDAFDSAVSAAIDGDDPGELAAAAAETRRGGNMFGGDAWDRMADALIDLVDFSDDPAETAELIQTGYSRVVEARKQERGR